MVNRVKINDWKIHRPKQELFLLFLFRTRSKSWVCRLLYSLRIYTCSIDVVSCLSDLDRRILMEVNKFFTLEWGKKKKNVIMFKILLLTIKLEEEEFEKGLRKGKLKVINNLMIFHINDVHVVGWPWLKRGKSWRNEIWTLKYWSLKNLSNLVWVHQIFHTFSLFYWKNLSF